MTKEQALEALERGQALLTALEPIMLAYGGQAGAGAAMISTGLVSLAELIEPAVRAQGDAAAFLLVLTDLQERNDALAERIANS
jgi:hypothetical protein